MLGVGGFPWCSGKRTGLDVVINKFTLHSHYCVHFRPNAFGEKYVPSLGPLSLPLLFFYKIGFGIKYHMKVDMPVAAVWYEYREAGILVTRAENLSLKGRPPGLNSLRRGWGFRGMPMGLKTFLELPGVCVLCLVPTKKGHVPYSRVG